MCLMLNCVQTSKVQIQIHNQIWSSCFWRFLVLVMFTFCGHLVFSFDMVAELVRTKVQKIRNRIRSMTKTTSSSSSGERKRFKRNLNLQEEADISMFAQDHRVPRVPQPTSFDGVKPSFVEWSEEVIAYLAVTDDHEFIPLLSAAAASKDVIEKDVMFKGILSERLENIDKITAQKVQKEQDKAKAITANKPQDAQDLTKEINDIQAELDKLNTKLEQKKSPSFMRLQVTQMSWSGESCELLIQIRGPSPDWRFGVKCQFISQDQQKLGPSHSSNRSCHRWSGMQRSQRMSFSSTIIGWNSSQSMRRSVRKRSQTQSRSHLHFRMSRETSLSPSMSVLVIQRHGLRFMHY